MNDANPEDLFNSYLYDFVRMVHMCNQSDHSAADSELAVSVLCMFCWLIQYYVCIYVVKIWGSVVPIHSRCP